MKIGLFALNYGACGMHLAQTGRTVYDCALLADGIFCAEVHDDD